MNDNSVIKSDQPNKAAHWADHITCWEKSKLSQPEYCRQAGIGYASFVYWRGKLSNKSKTMPVKFMPVSISPTKSVNTEAPKSIQIKLMSGHVVYIPANLPVTEIAALINAIGTIHA